MQIDVEGLELLSDEECRALLAEEAVGRVAVSLHALPAVIPVNYRLLGDSILFFTAPGMKLNAARSGAVIGFEVDQIDKHTETGWSVMVVGVASEITDPDAITSARGLGVRSWAPGDHSHLIRLGTDFLSGRRITKPTAAASDGMGP